MPPVRYVRDGGGTAGAGRFLAHARVTWSSPGHQIPPREPGIWIRPPALIRPSSWPCPARHVTVVLVAAPNSCVASPAPSVLAAGNRSNRRPATTSPCRSPPLIFPVITSNPSGTLSQPFQGGLHRGADLFATAQPTVRACRRMRHQQPVPRQREEGIADPAPAVARLITGRRPPPAPGESHCGPAVAGHAPDPVRGCCPGLRRWPGPWRLPDHRSPGFHAAPVPRRP